MTSSTSSTPSFPKAISTLENSVINLTAIREDSKKELLTILDSLSSESICLILDSDLAGPLNHILSDGTSILKEHNVKEFKELTKKTLDNHSSHILFIIRPYIKSTRMIASHIKEILKKKSPENENDISFHIYFVPKRRLVCDEVLKKEGIYNLVQIGEYHLDLIPYDDDLLSLEIPQCFKELYLDNDKTNLHTIAASLIKLQNLYGMIPKVTFKGEMSKVVWQMMSRFRNNNISNKVAKSIDPEIHQLLIIDRIVDLVSPMCTPLTYEGLIDEFLQIINGYVKIDADILIDNEENDTNNNKKINQNYKIGEKISIALNSNDKLYADIRDFNIEKLGPYLQEKAKNIRDKHDEFRNNKKNTTISDLREFVKTIPGLKATFQQLQQHINITEKIKKNTDNKKFRDLWMIERVMLEGIDPTPLYDQLEEMIGCQEPLMKVLRLLCLLSLTNNGIKSKVYDHLRREMIQTYGFEFLLILSNLEKIGFLRKKDNLWSNSDTLSLGNNSMNISSAFNNVRKSLKLINDSINVNEPNDISYVTSGYAPLSVRLVEAVIKNKSSNHSWENITDALRQLPGPHASLSQVNNKPDEMEENDLGFGGGGERKTMLVYFIGGITFMEIAAIRHLSKQQHCMYDIIIATTQIINGGTLLQSLLEKELAHSLKDKM